ncbi:MAG: isoaspartyl peptidase/L-asparaginase [Chloroflexota bacterium]|nr:isoaspartyl peptidase/L-asparaginase [Chloroflexota bacterium]
MAEKLRAIAVHGGAGGKMPERRADVVQIHEGLEAAIAAADACLDRGGSALDAVQAAIVVLEDEPRLNAGRGSVPTSAGNVEMDAGIMCGTTLRAGAVALASLPRNPIAVARLVLEDGEHVLLAGAGADDFARRAGARLEKPNYFLAGARGEHRRGDGAQKGTELGTVGAVVSDGMGNLAAGTSSGGARGQLPGRIGDSPIIGAGVYAESRTCAVSCTGGGEAIMRTVLAHRIARAVDGGASPSEACRQAVRGALSDARGAGGAIALDGSGNVGICFNTAVMHRAWKVGDGSPSVAST